MGCDIHAVVQVKQPDGSWKTAELPIPEEDQKYFGQGAQTSTNSFGWFLNRNYDMFAILADVRNGSGFAGCDTGNGFVPIAPHRGLPVGVELSGYTDENQWKHTDELDGVWMGEHSYTWLTLEEFLNNDWNQVTKKRGWINAQEYRRMLAAGDKWPHNWSGGVTGPRISYVAIDELEKLATGNADDEVLRNTYAVYEWEITYKEAFRRDWENFMSLKELGDPKDIRIVMGFDS